MKYIYEINLLNLINDIRNNVVNDSTLPIILGVDEQHPNMVAQPGVLNAHENNSKQDSKDKEMDNHNNEVSIKEFEKKNKTDSKTAIDKFKENLKNKKLKIIKPRYSESGGLP